MPSRTHTHEDLQAHACTHYAYVHTLLHTGIHTDIHTCTYTYISTQTSMHASMRACMSACTHRPYLYIIYSLFCRACMPTYIPACTHPSVHPFIHPSVHPSTHTLHYYSMTYSLPYHTISRATPHIIDTDIKHEQACVQRCATRTAACYDGVSYHILLLATMRIVTDIGQVDATLDRQRQANG